MARNSNIKEQKLLKDSLKHLLQLRDKLNEYYEIKPTNPIFSALIDLDACEREIKKEL